MCRLFLLWVLSFSSCCAFAENLAWLQLDYTYTDFSSSEGAQKETGRLAGLRGELGTTFAQFGVSVGGEYQDGNLNFEGSTLAGTPATLVTKDYFRDTRLLVHYFMGPFVFASGPAQREWYDNVVGNYHRRDTFNYLPMITTMYSGNIYFKLELDFGFNGKTQVSLSELGAPAHDLTFTRSSGSGLVAEVGYQAMTVGKFSTRLFFNYRRLSLADAGTQSDGVRGISIAKTSLDFIQAGIGVGF